MASGPKAYLTFRIARQDLALEATRVRAILPLSDLMPLPLDGDFLGWTTFQGAIVLVHDLVARLAIVSQPGGAQRKILIVELASGVIAFLADRVSDIVLYRLRNLHNGLLKGHGRPRRLLDLDALFANQPLSPSNASSISRLAAGVITVSGNRGGPP